MLIAFPTGVKSNGRPWGSTDSREKQRAAVETRKVQPGGEQGIKRPPPPDDSPSLLLFSPAHLLVFSSHFLVSTHTVGASAHIAIQHL